MTALLDVMAVRATGDPGAAVVDCGAPGRGRHRDGRPCALRIHVHGGEIYGEETRWLEYQVLDQAPDTKGGLWAYRRLIDADLFPPGAGYLRDISMLNWPGNDYRDQSILDRSPREQAQAQDAKRVSLGFLYWLQTEAPRPGGASGSPGLMPRPDVIASADAPGKHPYIRESRRIRSRRIIVEQDVSADYQKGARAGHLQMAAVTEEIAGTPDSLEAAALPAEIRAKVGL